MPQIEKGRTGAIALKVATFGKGLRDGRAELP
jgi:hypothetical protein